MICKAEATLLYRAAVERWGIPFQKVMAVEEMAELTVELTHSMRGLANREKIAEEVADVQLMMEQIVEMLCLTAEVAKYRQAKLERLQEILGGN